jgi:hypothetical protein
VSSFSDGESCEVTDDVWRKARKTHTCSACRETIAPGQRYHRTFYVFEGDPGVVIRCARCEAIYTHLNARMRDEGDHGEYCAAELDCGDTYEERWEEAPPPEIAALAFWLPGDPLPVDAEAAQATSGERTDGRVRRHE